MKLLAMEQARRRLNHLAQAVRGQGSSGSSASAPPRVVYRRVFSVAQIDLTEIDRAEQRTGHYEYVGDRRQVHPLVLPHYYRQCASAWQWRSVRYYDPYLWIFGVPV